MILFPEEVAKGGRESDGTVEGAAVESAKDPTFSNEAMERHRCKRCYRRFANGRALAGHMRSRHVVPVRLPRPFPSPSAASSSSPVAAMEAEEEEKGPATYAFREKRMNSFWLADPGFSFTSAFEDRESDTESFLHSWPKRRRSVPAEEPLSSVARSLMLLSRDAWSKYEAEERKSNGWDEVEAEKYVEEEEDGIGSRSRRRSSRFRCGTCRKVFRSYKALGGHRASHKRERAECVPTAAVTRIHSEDFSGASAAHHDAKLWRCPYCYRVFGSGQAFGGHKRTHISSAVAATSPAPHLPHPPFPVAAAHRNNGGRDLNLPAPSEGEAELSQQSSHASDFLSPIRSPSDTRIHSDPPTAAVTRIHSEDFSGASAAHHDAKLWRCPYCYRVFGSGQAFGGHKRTHISSAVAATSPAPHLPHPPFPVAAAHRNNGGRDLNLPAPSEGEAELSQQSSHASDFLSPIRSPSETRIHSDPPTAAVTRIHSEDFPGASAAHHDAKLWRCPYCYRVFGSGQAFGGHKRTHISSAVAATSPAPHLPHPPFPVAAAHRNNGGRDLNLPAPSEGEAELSQQSSHASDFLSPIRSPSETKKTPFWRQFQPNPKARGTKLHSISHLFEASIGNEDPIPSS